MLLLADDPASPLLSSLSIAPINYSIAINFICSLWHIKKTPQMSFNTFSYGNVFVDLYYDLTSSIILDGKRRLCLIELSFELAKYDRYSV